MTSLRLFIRLHPWEHQALKKFFTFIPMHQSSPVPNFHASSICHGPQKSEVIVFLISCPDIDSFLLLTLLSTERVKWIRDVGNCCRVALEGDTLHWYQWGTEMPPHQVMGWFKAIMLCQFRPSDGGSLYDGWVQEVIYWNCSPIKENFSGLGQFINTFSILKLRHLLFYQQLVKLKI